MSKYIFCFFFFVSQAVNAQTFSLSGYIRDSLSGEPLIGASIVVKTRMCQANQFGYYNIQIEKTNHLVINVSYIGYEPFEKIIELNKNTQFNIRLISNIKVLDEVVVKTENDRIFHEKNASSFKIQVKQIKNNPSVFGESDVLKTLQSLPGVQGGTEGTVGLHIRGGSPDQNLILLDDVPVYNVNHLFGFFSVFNTDALADVELYKGFIPAQYSGRAASVLAISMKEGNNKTLKKSIYISPISSKILIEGPLKKDKSSFLFTARRTWLDILMKAFNRGNLNAPSYFFDDINAKMNFNINTKNKLFIGYYSGRDAFGLSSNEDENKTKYAFAWGNRTFNVRWASQLSSKIFLSLIPYYTSYNFQTKNQIQTPQSDFYSKIKSDISDIGIKANFDLATRDMTDKFGFSIVKHTFLPSIYQVKGTAIKENNSDSLNRKNLIEANLYYEKKIRVSTKFDYLIATNWANYFLTNHTYSIIEPRFGLNYYINKYLSIKSSYGRNAQFLHLLTNSALNFPTDLWVPATDKLPPLKSNNYSTGLYYSPAKLPLQIIVEGYHRRMNNLLEYSEGVNFLQDPNTPWEDKVTIGKGNAYGCEFYIKKTTGKLTGWLSYTYAHSNRIFQEINAGKAFPYKYDRRHSIGNILFYTINERNSISSNFNLSTGGVVTIPPAKYQGITPPIMTNDPYINESYLYHFNQLNDIPERNNFRMPIYHRLDISYKNRKLRNKGERVWSIDIYNVYNHRNAFFIYYEKGALKQFTMFPIIPSISYEFIFK